MIQTYRCTQLGLFLLVAILFCASCATNRKEQDLENFRLFWNPTLDKSKNDSSDNHDRIRVDGSSLVIEGNLIEGDCERVTAKLSSASIDTLVVNSQGGSVSEGLCIANNLAKNGVRKTVVRGICWSSCANYLFLGANKKVIERGSVGFHGNGIALMNKYGLLEIVEKSSNGLSLGKEDRLNLRSYLGRNTSDQPLSSEETSILKKMVKDYQIEKQFFASLGIPQRFFEMTQRPDKGEGNGKQYLFLLPSSAYFKRELGVTVVGDQDVEFVERANLKFPIGLLLKN